MERSFYNNLADKALSGEAIGKDEARRVLTDNNIDLFQLLTAAYEVRRAHWNKDVTIHIINNGQNGHCPEDCHYCAQAKSSQADIQEYPIKTDEEFLEEARIAYEKGAYRYCMVFAGRGPTKKRTEHLAQLIRSIKEKYPIEICVSAGLLDDEKAEILKSAGLDRLNHNLNTSEKNYPSICSTHTYQDRINTLNAARKAGLQLCSGVIIGMKEGPEDVVELGFKFREMNIESIPVNMLVPIDGTKLAPSPDLTPELCLRTLCLFRFLNPRAEIRVSAGRELHLQNIEVLAFYPANSLFLDGYLNTKGAERLRTLTMLRNAGFTVKSEFPLEDLIGNEQEKAGENPAASNPCGSRPAIKDLHDLRPFKNSGACS